MDAHTSLPLSALAVGLTSPPCDLPEGPSRPGLLPASEVRARSGQTQTRTEPRTRAGPGPPRAADYVVPAGGPVGQSGQLRNWGQPEGASVPSGAFGTCDVPTPTEGVFAARVCLQPCLHGDNPRHTFDYLDSKSSLTPSLFYMQTGCASPSPGVSTTTRCAALGNGRPARVPLSSAPSGQHLRRVPWHSLWVDMQGDHPPWRPGAVLWRWWNYEDRQTSLATPHRYCRFLQIELRPATSKNIRLKAQMMVSAF